MALRDVQGLEERTRSMRVKLQDEIKKRRELTTFQRPKAEERWHKHFLFCPVYSKVMKR